jgi:ABC-type sugar transport system permease subunit
MAGTRSTHRVFRRLRQSTTAYGFILPFFFFSITFGIIPIFQVVVLSFQTGGFLGSRDWAGIQSYADVFREPEYLESFLNNLIYLVMMVPIGQVIAFSIAVPLRKQTRFSGVFETIVFLPLLISMVAAGIVVLYIFGARGPMNYVLRVAGIGELNWLGHPFRAKVVISVLEIWKGATFYTFIYIAALRSIPDAFYEAADIEGAGAFRKLRTITLPLIRHTIFFCVIMTSIWNLQIFDSIYVTTSGGPLNATSSVVFQIYRTTFKHNEVGIGAALSIMFLVFILIFTALQMRFANTDVEY